MIKHFNLAYYWYKPYRHFALFLLLPFSWLFAAIVNFRRFLYRVNILKTQHFPVPIVVVGNITVGGTGKTPFVIHLAQFLKSQGYSPGIVSRGVGGKKNREVQWIDAKASPQDVGDEAILIWEKTACPMVIGVDRVKAVVALLQQAKCDVVISDDGLQHYRLGRTVEIAMLDEMRYLGNECLLPAGPLREPAQRLREVDFVVIHRAQRLRGNLMRVLPETENKFFDSELTALEFFSLIDPTKKIKFADFPYQKIHAYAGIGNPDQFFLMLRKAGLQVIAHPFKDHHLYRVEDFINDEYPIVMTEKDAVKCRAFANHRYYVLKTAIHLDPAFYPAFLAKL